MRLFAMVVLAACLFGVSILLAKGYADGDPTALANTTSEKPEKALPAEVRSFLREHPKLKPLFEGLTEVEAYDLYKELKRMSPEDLRIVERSFTSPLALPDYSGAKPDGNATATATVSPATKNLVNIASVDTVPPRNPAIAKRRLSPSPTGEALRILEREGRGERVVSASGVTGTGAVSSGKEGENEQTYPYGVLSPDEVRAIRKKALAYERAAKEPLPPHPGRFRVVPYTPYPQRLRLAVGYATLVQVPFRIAASKDSIAVVGDRSAFEVFTLPDRKRVVIFPKRYFAASNLILVPEDPSLEPASFYLEEAQDRKGADYVVKVLPPEKGRLTPRDLARLALEGWLPPAVASLRELVCSDHLGGRVLRTCRLRHPDYVVVLLDGRFECRRGCTFRAYFPASDRTAIGFSPLEEPALVLRNDGTERGYTLNRIDGRWVLVPADLPEVP
ncbi:hypothetical protein [Thermosulfurimonas sp. F29]|uniref:hypothetical protein n=1 Tax=Thermosulfurimonas sp. F29 TaxID=2867247 RepID=UPI001C83AE1F|nr:hypothetical protein [Thermosulfurimonas sp. F29]MBX6424222.1 hypothetical protein [Thermosulfurimonas sp. F29]